MQLGDKLGNGEFGEVLKVIPRIGKRNTRRDQRSRCRDQRSKCNFYQGVFTQSVFKKPEEVAVKTLKNQQVCTDDRLV